jgi:hypothetical protein
LKLKLKLRFNLNMGVEFIARSLEVKTEGGSHTGRFRLALPHADHRSEASVQGSEPTRQRGIWAKDPSRARRIGLGFLAQTELLYNVQ